MNTNKKIFFIIFIFMCFIFLFNIKIYAVDEPFKLDVTTADVILNGRKSIPYTGGSGNITWTSDDNSIATVENGFVQGIKIGTTTIRATRGTESASCTVNVIYNGLSIISNCGTSGEISLILNEHDSEKLTTKVIDNNSDEVSNASVSFSSSDSSIVSVDESSGLLKALKAGTAKITAKAAGVESTRDVKVYSAPVFTNFSNAKYENILESTSEVLKISNVAPNKDSNYYYIITSDNKKPELVINTNGAINMENISNINALIINQNENYMYTRNFSQFTELNQDLYLWVIETLKIDNFYSSEGKLISFSSKFIVEGKKIERAPLPALNLILQTFNISSYNLSSGEDKSTYIRFNFPTNTEKRNFTLKIGKITDSTILNKIKNSDYSGITDLLTYAKTHDSVYNQSLTTTSEAYFKSNTVLFDGRSLLEDRSYYYIYAVFDDENGKYYPIEGVTLGQAYFYSSNDSWDLLAYTSSNFKWDNLTPTPSGSDPTPTPQQSNPTPDPTVAPTVLPNTGTNIIIIAISILIIVLGGTVFYHKYNEYKDIK